MVTAFKNVVVFVSDLARAKEFYLDKLKLPLTGESPMMLQFFPEPSLGVALALHDDARGLVGRHTGITLTVSGIEEFCRKLGADGVSFPEPLESSPWGKMAVVADPDGNQFALVEGP